MTNKEKIDYEKVKAELKVACKEVKAGLHPGWKCDKLWLYFKDQWCIGVSNSQSYYGKFVLSKNIEGQYCTQTVLYPDVKKAMAFVEKKP